MRILPKKNGKKIPWIEFIHNSPDDVRMILFFKSTKSCLKYAKKLLKKNPKGIRKIKG